MHVKSRPHHRFKANCTQIIPWFVLSVIRFRVQCGNSGWSFGQGKQFILPEVPLLLIYSCGGQRGFIENIKLHPHENVCIFKALSLLWKSIWTLMSQNVWRSLLKIQNIKASVICPQMLLEFFLNHFFAFNQLLFWWFLVDAWSQVLYP